jgi:hypothetical protein
MRAILPCNSKRQAKIQDEHLSLARLGCYPIRGGGNNHSPPFGSQYPYLITLDCINRPFSFHTEFYIQNLIKNSPDIHKINRIAKNDKKTKDYT